MTILLSGAGRMVEERRQLPTHIYLSTLSRPCPRMPLRLHSLHHRPSQTRAPHPYPMRRTHIARLHEFVKFINGPVGTCPLRSCTIDLLTVGTCAWAHTIIGCVGHLPMVTPLRMWPIQQVNHGDNQENGYPQIFSALHKRRKYLAEFKNSPNFRYAFGREVGTTFRTSDVETQLRRDLNRDCAAL